MNLKNIRESELTTFDYTFWDWRKNFGRSGFLDCIVLFWLCTLPVPTIEVFKLNHSLGRFPIYLMYVGLLTPEYWFASVPIVIGHILISYSCAFLLFKFIGFVRTKKGGSDFNE